MGKIRKVRQKFHITAPKDTAKNDNSILNKNIKQGESQKSEEIPLAVGDNIFSGLNIDLSNLNNKLTDDTRSVKSFKSVKSELGIKHQVSKKDKLKLRKEVLLKKIDTLQQLKKESGRRKKRKNVAIIGDTNALHDALPDLELLLKSTEETKLRKEQRKANLKGISKATKRRKETLQNINSFKALMKNKQFLKNPAQTLSLHLEAKIKQL